MIIPKDKSQHCCYCGREFNHHIHCTADHLIPVSRGGANSEWNKRNCCSHCNTQKKDMMPHDFLDYLLQNEMNFSASARQHFDLKVANVRKIIAYVESAGEAVFASRQKYEWFKRRYLSRKVA